MSSNFNLSVTSQSAMFFEDLKIKASDKLIEFSNSHTNLARFTGLSIGLCSSLLDLAQCVSNVGESAIKGVANIFGSPFSKKCSFKKGVKQLFVQVPLKLVNDGLGLAFGIVYEILGRPIGMLISPKGSLKLSKKNAEAKIRLLDIVSNGRRTRLRGNPIEVNIMKINLSVTKLLYK